MSRLCAAGLLLLAGLSAESEASTRLTLLDPGQAPHRELRLDPKPGKGEWMRMTMAMGMAMEMAGMGLPMPELPPMVLDMSLKDLQLHGDGTFTYAFQLASARAQSVPGGDADMARELQAALAPLVGMAGTARVSTTGEQLDWSFAPSPGMDASMIESMRQSMVYSSTPFPSEPVGVGARWQVERDIENQGLRVSQVETLQLVEWTGDVVVIDIQVEQNAAEQEFSPAGMPPGATARLLNLHTEGRSRTRLHLGRLVPEEAQVKVQSAFAFEVEAEGMNMPMGMTMDMDTRIEPGSKPKRVKAR